MEDEVGGGNATTCHSFPDYVGRWCDKAVRLYGQPIVTLVGEAEASALVAQEVRAASRLPLRNVDQRSVSPAARDPMTPVEIAHISGQLPHALCSIFGTLTDALLRWIRIPGREPHTFQEDLCLNILVLRAWHTAISVGKPTIRPRTTANASLEVRAGYFGKGGIFPRNPASCTRVHAS